MLDLDGEAVIARVAEPPNVESAVRLASHEGSQAQAVVAPMPGNVIAVRVKEGDEVEAGQVLLVLEAMKMEHQMIASDTGTVKEVRVEVGQMVDPDTVMIVVDAD